MDEEKLSAALDTLRLDGRDQEPATRAPVTALLTRMGIDLPTTLEGVEDAGLDNTDAQEVADQAVTLVDPQRAEAAAPIRVRTTRDSVRKIPRPRQRSGPGLLAFAFPITDTRSIAR